MKDRYKIKKINFLNMWIKCDKKTKLVKLLKVYKILTYGKNIYNKIISKNRLKGNIGSLSIFDRYFNFRKKIVKILYIFIFLNFFLKNNKYSYYFTKKINLLKKIK